MKTKISEKSLVLALKMDFQRSNVDFSTGFQAPVQPLYSPPKGPKEPYIAL